MKFAYLVTFEKDGKAYNRFATNLRGVRAAKKSQPAAEVRRMAWANYKDGQSPFGWDSVTFRMLSDRIA